MHIILLNDKEVTEIVECTFIEIYEMNEKPSIYFVSAEQGEGKIIGINATFYVVDECVFEIGQNLTNEQLDQLISNDRKNEFLGG